MQAATSPPSTRLVLVDVVRGIALVLMAAYHFCFDLNYFGLTRIDFNHAPFWLAARAFIVTLFLSVMGISLALSHRRAIRWPAVGRRLLLIGGSAALVSAASYLLFPRSYIFFGVLHFVALASLLGLAFLRLGWLNVVIGIAVLALGIGYHDPLFNRPALQWFGLMTYKPFTEDYVPLLPWFGVVLLGLFLGSRAERWPPRLRQWRAGGLSRLLAWGGRHSLPIYLLHQPLLMGLLYGVLHLEH